MVGYNIEKKIYIMGTGDGLHPANLPFVFRNSAVRLTGGLRYREAHIHSSLRGGGAISAGFLKFGRLRNGGYNIEKKIYTLCTGGGLIPANFSLGFRNSVVFLRGLQSREAHIHTRLRET